MFRCSGTRLSKCILPPVELKEFMEITAPCTVKYVEALRLAFMPFHRYSSSCIKTSFHFLVQVILQHSSSHGLKTYFICIAWEFLRWSQVQVIRNKAPFIFPELKVKNLVTTMSIIPQTLKLYSATVKRPIENNHLKLSKNYCAREALFPCRWVSWNQ